MIILTEAAANKVLEIAIDEDLGGKPLRARIIGGGCAGFTYDLFFADEMLPMDEEFESHGVKIVVDPLSFQYLNGVEIDYVDNLYGAGFKFINPNVSSSCGCGSSVSF